MGNCQCQEADVAAAVIQHPDGRTERAYCPLAAVQVMDANPGHYVAVITTITHPRSSSAASDTRSKGSRRRSGGGGGGKPVRYLKLLSPEDTLIFGHFYRLVSFEDVMREFGSKRRVRLSKLLANKKEEEIRKQREEANTSSSEVTGEAPAEETQEGMMMQCSVGSDGESSGDKSSSSIRVARLGQWRPTLKPIAETGTFKW